MRIRKKTGSLTSIFSISCTSLRSPVPVSCGATSNTQKPTSKSPQQPHRLACYDSRASDQPNQPIGGGQYCSGSAGAQQENKIMLEKDERWRDGERSNDTRKGSFMGAEIETTNLTPSSCSRQGVERWGEGEKAYPLKRRGRFERPSDDEEIIMEKAKKMKTKMNKKCVLQKGNNKKEEESNEIVKEGLGGATNNTSVKRKARGGALMEGSRCSRVNGRGWRCCQQTLVGYSLCEHHLGKGRLRSMNSVRSRSMARTAPAPKKAESKPLPSSSSSEEKQTKRLLSDTKLDGVPADEDGDDTKPLMIAKKKVKLGGVKARSISSLLGLANNGIAVSESSK